MKATKVIAWMVIGVAVPAACRSMHDNHEDEIPIDLKDVPPNVMASAKAAKPGIEFTKAWKEMENGALIYELSGRVGGEEFEVEVSPDGKVLEIESGHEDHGEGHDDDDD
jgi:uncharacterized membrane protein YkoI